MLLPTKDVQQFLRDKGFYDNDVDGVVGADTREALDRFLMSKGVNALSWWPERDRIAVEQLILRDAGMDVGTIDGFLGPQTKQAFAEYVRADRDRTDRPEGPPPPALPVDVPRWPRQADVPSFYGEMGENQVMLPLPYPMMIAWDTGTVINRMSVHRKCADSAGVVLKRVLDVYGLPKIQSMGLDLFGGSLNVRKMRGGSQWSMHSWGIAMDFDPDHNGLHTPFKQARFGQPEYDQWWEAWHSQGWVCLGPDRNYDTMHVQAARL